MQDCPVEGPQTARRENDGTKKQIKNIRKDKTKRE
jgi:hypothetical protein